MKKFWLLYLVPLLFTGSAESMLSPPETLARCPSPIPGPPGAPGSSITTYGAFYNLTPQVLGVNDFVSFPSQQSALNITPTGTQFTILESGYYYIHYGISNSTTGSGNTTTLILTVDGVPVNGSQLVVQALDHLISIGFITPITAGQVVRVQNREFEITTGVGNLTNNSTFIDFTRIAPL